MKIFNLIFSLSIHLILNSQIKYNNNEVYIFARSTESKINIIAEDFNLKDKFITHIGIGYFENDSIKIFNVSNNVKNHKNSSLLIENYETFVNLSDIKSVSIWSIKINKKTMRLLKKNISAYCNLKIDFDNNFILNDDNFIYCSEFVYKVLNETNIKKFYFSPVIKKLNQFYTNALKRENFIYIPVDFYQFINFKKIFEYKF